MERMDCKVSIVSRSFRGSAKLGRMETGKKANEVDSSRGDRFDRFVLSR